MTRRFARVATIGVAALFAWYAVERAAPNAPRPAEIFADAAPAFWSWHDTLAQGETFDHVMRRGGFDGSTTREILGAAPMLDPRRLRANMPVEFVADSAGAPPREIVLKLAIDSLLRVRRGDDGSWIAMQEVLPWVTDTVLLRGAVPSGGSLRDALSADAHAHFPNARERLYASVAGVYEYRVDMSSELQPGDSVVALVERSRGPEDATRIQTVLATRLRVNGRTIEAFHFPADSATGRRARHYDAAGMSLATSFLRTPIEFSRISSRFGLRFHPILGVRRMHQGTDYAAVSGTPVRSIADGRVVRAVYNPGGYGNLVEIRHPNGLVSRYAHLRGFARGVRAGTNVAQGQTIGYVGMTGLATAPHLHFEILQAGKAANPERALRNADGTPLPARDRPQFDQVRSMLASLLTRHEQGARATEFP